MQQRLFKHVSIVVMAFKCHAGLDTSITITPGTPPYTSLHKQRTSLSFVIQGQCRVIPGEQSRAGESATAPSPPQGQRSQRRARRPTCTFPSPASLPPSPGKGFGEGRSTQSQTPVIWHEITQMGQTEPAEPTGSWE